MIDLHVHTVWCDGKNTPEEMILSAIDKGLETIGILMHSYLSFDADGTVLPSRLPLFLTEIANLKQKYADKINVLCGIEADIFSEFEKSLFDYVIGSVHYVYVDGTKYPIDNGEETFVKVCNEYFNGDYYALAESYFDKVSTVLEKTDADIIGHFDIITKYNGDGKYFSEDNPRYIKAYQKAVDKLVVYGKPFEINTGAMSRGYKTQPYPSKSIIDYIISKGGKFILSSDAHHRDNIAFAFEKFKKYL